MNPLPAGPQHAVYLPDIRAGREQQMLAEFEWLIVESDWQQRRRMKPDATLRQVAENRAQFIATLKPEQMDGIDDDHRFPIYGDGWTPAPNALLRMAGYELPWWFLSDCNNVESFSYGRATVFEVVQRLLKSDAHREHITGAGSFGIQEHYGVAVRDVDGENFKPVYVFISAI